MATNTQNKLDVDFVESVERAGRLANQEDHETSAMTALRKNPWVLVWCCYAIWMLILNSFDNQAAGAVLGIPEFRKVDNPGKKLSLLDVANA